MKDKKIIQNYKLILIGIIFSLICISPTITSAVSVPINYTDKWEYYRYIDLGGCKGGRWFGDFETKTSFTIELKKQFDLIAGNIKTLSQNESSVISTGVELKAMNYDVEGSYNYESADRATPPLDGKTYSREYISQGGDCGGLYVVRDKVRGGITRQAGYTMDNNIGYTLTSSNNDIIDCSSRNLCVTKNNGTATVTVSFTGTGSYYLQRSYDFGNYRKFEYWIWGDMCPVGYTKTNSSRTEKAYQSYCVANDTVWTSANDACGLFNPGKKCFEEIPAYNAWEYTLNPISYTIQVARPNTPPTVTYDKTDPISYTTATANWSYSDPEGDVQTDAQIQIATDSGFSYIVFSNGQAGAATNMTISGLAHSTTYYPRVKVWNNENGEGQWVNGAAFNTKANNPPNLDQLSCGGTGTGYTTGNINWNYTGIDEAGDELILRAKWKRPEDGVWTVVELPYNTRTGNIDISGLISGYAYDIQVSLNDNRNTHLGDRWKGCGTLTPQNYPAPKVTYSISKTGDSSKSETNGETLVLNTGDNVNATWSITDTVGLESCALSTTGGANLPGEQAFRDSLSLTDAGFSGNIYNKQVPTIPEDRTYSVNLICPGKPAETVMSVNQTINLKVESYPTVSCSIENDKRSVQEGDTDITIKATVGNVNSYTWKIGRGINDTNPINSNGATSNLNLTQNLSYVGLDFGRYSPWIEVTKSGGDNRTTGKKSCGTITNFGSRTIREVNP